MGFFKPQTARDLAEFFSKMVETWDALTPEEKALDGFDGFINPDEPVVLTVPNPEYDGDPNEYEEDDFGNSRYLHFHVESYGGGGDIEDDGTDVGHRGAAIGGMEIDQRAFLYNGRRYQP